MNRVWCCIACVICLMALSAGSLVAQEPPGTQSGSASESQDLQERIESLEKRIQELSDEARARKRLEITEEESQEKEREVLEAVGREYSLDPKKSLGLDYSLSYSYSPSEVFVNQLDLRRDVNHTLRHTISSTYSVLDNLAVTTSFPVVYRYNKLGTDEALDETDIGDITIGVLFQPIKARSGQTRGVLVFSAGFPSGRSPYTLNPTSELSTGSGTYQLSLSSSFSKQVDPVVVFWNLGYNHQFPVTGIDRLIADEYFLDEVIPGGTVSAGAGLAYAMSYKVSLNLSFGYSYQTSTTYRYANLARKIKTGDQVAANLNIGMGWRFSSKTTLSFSVGANLNGPGFSTTVRVPFNFVL